MKLSLKIMTALFIFAVIGITGCSKNQLGLDVEENAFSETIGGTDMQHELKIQKITNILEGMSGVKVTNGYSDTKTGLTGTLYKYVDTKGITQKIVKLDKKPENTNKTWYPQEHTVDAYKDKDGNWIFICNGPAKDCFGWADTSIWMFW